MPKADNMPAVLWLLRSRHRVTAPENAEALGDRGGGEKIDPDGMSGSILLAIDFWTIGNQALNHFAPQWYCN